MIVGLGNHLWQSTVVVALAALLALALRNNAARIRHAIWFAASVKFLVPFSLLAGFGGVFATWLPQPSPASGATALLGSAKQMRFAAEPFTQPFAPLVLADVHALPATAEQSMWPLVLAALWALGFLSVVVMRLRGWMRVRAAVRSSMPLDVPGPWKARSVQGLLEPGVVGIRRPLLLLPAGIEQRLTAAQLRTVLEHESTHVQRRDNLTSAVHMLVEAVCWFHPAVWWVGAKLVEERERACDEQVLQTCGEPEVYAEGILNVCKLYVESPVACVSGVSGADLKKRVSAIMSARVGERLSVVRRWGLIGLSLLIVSAPMFAGVLEQVQQLKDSGARFEAVTLKPCDPATAKPTQGTARPGFRSIAAAYAAMVTPGHAIWSCATLSQLIPAAYTNTGLPLLNTTMFFRDQDNTQPTYVKGGPSWIRSDGFSIEAKVPEALTAELLGPNPSRDLRLPPPPAWSDALRALLEERFQLKVSRVIEQRDMYALTIASGGLKKDRISVAPPGDCQTNDQYSAAAAAAPPRAPQAPPRTVSEMMANTKNPRLCGRAYSGLTEGGSYTEYTSVTMAELARLLSGQLDYVVLDRTGTTEIYNFTIPGGRTQEETRDQFHARALAELGLKLELVKGPAEVLRVDSVQPIKTGEGATR